MRILRCGAVCLIGKSVGRELVPGRDELANKVKRRGEGTTAVGKADTTFGFVFSVGEGKNKTGSLEESGIE